MNQEKSGLPKICVRCLVSGRVQGVFYRASTQRKAMELGINGWARNLSDGRVEVMACGGEREVKALQEWLWDGPAHATVTDVKVTEVEAQEMRGFSINQDFIPK